VWASAKLIEGWKPIRILVTADDGIVGGAQILWRQSKLWRLGYISKGPVALPESVPLAEFVLEVVRSSAKAEKLSFLIIQPPDLSKNIPAALPRDQFLPNVLSEIIGSTLVIDVSGTLETIEGQISKYTRTTLRQGVRRGTVIREGGRKDIGVFFKLMLATCERQGVRPHPASVAALVDLWDAAERSRCLRLTFAECNGETVAGALCLSFGITATIWKKGWNGAAGECRPNEMLIYDAIRWASAAGHKWFDFGSLNRNTAHALVNGTPLTEDQRTSRDIFHLRFGGQPRFLPDALVYFPNLLLRIAYKIIMLRLLRKRRKRKQP